MTLKETNPIAYAEFSYYRKQNIDFDIENVSADSREIVFWKCQANPLHTWATSIYRRKDSSVDKGCLYIPLHETHLHGHLEPLSR